MLDPLSLKWTMKNGPFPRGAVLTRTTIQALSAGREEDDQLRSLNRQRSMETAHESAEERRASNLCELNSYLELE
jgi:hypothetical protein